MYIRATNVTEQPMLFVAATASMTEIRTVMQRSFATLGQFFAKHGIKPLGPPLAIYHDWSTNQTAVDIGFPVSAPDAAKAAGTVLQGTTPSGPALKVVYTGAYDDLPSTYAALDAAMKQAHIPASARMWEVYKGDPAVTPEAELVTEIYTSVSAADAAKFPS